MAQQTSFLSPGLLVETAAATINLAQPRARLALRARGALAKLNTALGVKLSTEIGQRAEAQQIETLCLGPDEWVLLCDDAAPLLAASQKAYEEHPHSLVDVSGREITLEISGARATELLTLGLPRDPQSIVIGQGRRTVFDGVSVNIWRDGENAYRMDIWHSFAPHIFHLLETGCHELAAEIKKG